MGRTLASTGTDVTVLRPAADGTLAEVAAIASHAQTPDLPVPKPLLTWSAGPSRSRTAVLLPSWHEPGCDLERRRPIDLLPERSAEAVACCSCHPSVEVIRRDRGEPYVKGATAVRRSPFRSLTSGIC